MVFRTLLLILFFAVALPRLCFTAPAFASAVTNGIINISGLDEASGIAASRNNPACFGRIMIPAIRRRSCMRSILKDGIWALYALPGNTDSEDISIGPGPVTNVSYLYVADIGDNNENRFSIKLYQAPEPAVYFWQTNSPFAGRALKGMRTITLTYPDGAHNAEAEFVDPVTGDWFVLTKAATSRIYTAPKTLLDTTSNITLTFVGTLPV